MVHGPPSQGPLIADVRANVWGRGPTPGLLRVASMELNTHVAHGSGYAGHRDQAQGLTSLPVPGAFSSLLGQAADHD
jgi:hypothetical protein